MTLKTYSHLLPDDDVKLACSSNAILGSVKAKGRKMSCQMAVKCVDSDLGLRNEKPRNCLYLRGFR